MVRSLREPVSVIRFGPPAPPVNASSVSAKSLEPTSWWRVARGTVSPWQWAYGPASRKQAPGWSKVLKIMAYLAQVATTPWGYIGDVATRRFKGYE